MNKKKENKNSNNRIFLMMSNVERGLKYALSCRIGSFSVYPIAASNETIKSAKKRKQQLQNSEIWR